MEKIRLSNNIEFGLITNGIKRTDDDKTLTINLLPGDYNILEIDGMFSASDNTKKLYMVSDSGEELKIYIDYTVLTSIEKQTDTNADDTEVSGSVIIITLKKGDIVSKKITSIESNIETILQLLVR